MKLSVGDIGMKVADVKRSRSGGDRRRNRHWWIGVFVRKKRKMKMKEKEKIRENVFVLCERMWCDVCDVRENERYDMRERKKVVCVWVSECRRDSACMAVQVLLSKYHALLRYVFLTRYFFFFVFLSFDFCFS
jgi:hypothetical protein